MLHGPFGAACETRTASAPPSSPNNLTLNGKKKTSLTLKWNVPKSDGGSPVTKYTLMWDEGDVGA
jgi:hypothetical protein